MVRATVVHFATDGTQAIEALNCAQSGEKDQIDLMLMDINMPIQDGLQTVALIRSSETSYQHIPVVLWSSSERVEDVIKAYSAGANAYVVKPQGVADIVKLVESIHMFWCGKVLYPLVEKSA